MLENVAKDNKKIALRVAGERTGESEWGGCFDFKARLLYYAGKHSTRISCPQCHFYRRSVIYQ